MPDAGSPILDWVRWACVQPQVAYAAGVSPQAWELTRVLDFLPDNVGAANNGRLPYLVVTDFDEQYEHQTAAPRGGTRTSTIVITIHVRAFPTGLSRQRARQSVSRICNAISVVARTLDQLVIGDEQRQGMITRPYGFQATMTLTVETTYGPSYEGDC